MPGTPVLQQALSSVRSVEFDESSAHEHVERLEVTTSSARGIRPGKWSHHLVRLRRQHDDLRDSAHVEVLAQNVGRRQAN